MKKPNNTNLNKLYIFLCVLATTTLLFSLGACTVSNRADDGDGNDSNSAALSSTSIESLGIAINYTFPSGSSTARILKDDEETPENLEDDEEASENKGESIRILVNGEERIGKFAHEITDDFDDDSDNLYQFYRFYHVMDESSSDEISLGISLLINSEENQLVDAFLQIDFLNEETHAYEGGIYMLDSAGVETAEVDFKTYLFDFVYNGKGTLEHIHNNARDLLPSTLEEISLSVKGRR